jgi:hypothetical protein
MKNQWIYEKKLLAIDEKYAYMIMIELVTDPQGEGGSLS